MKKAAVLSEFLAQCMAKSSTGGIGGIPLAVMKFWEIFAPRDLRATIKERIDSGIGSARTATSSRKVPTRVAPIPNMPSRQGFTEARANQQQLQQQVDLYNNALRMRMAPNPEIARRFSRGLLMTQQQLDDVQSYIAQNTGAGIGAPPPQGPPGWPFS
jgi:hypothetical protein